MSKQQSLLKGQELEEDTDAPWPGLDSEERATELQANLKSLAFFATLAVAYGGLAFARAPMLPLPEPSVWRARWQCLLLLGMLLELIVSCFLKPPATKDMEIYPLIKLAGNSMFLTCWILYTQTIQTLATVIAEMALLFGSPCPRLMAFSYTQAVFVDSIGIMLTLLYLKFNHFEKKFQTEVVELWERRGYRFGLLSLLGHVPSLPIGVLDIPLRDSRFMQLCNPPWTTNMMKSASFGVVYFNWIHILWWLTDYQNWPYPFLHDLDTIPKRMVFLLGVILGLAIVMLPFLLLI